jgi:hypothetical protein
MFESIIHSCVEAATMEMADDSLPLLCQVHKFFSIYVHVLTCNFIGRMSEKKSQTWKIGGQCT